MGGEERSCGWRGSHCCRLARYSRIIGKRDDSRFDDRNVWVIPMADVDILDGISAAEDERSINIG